MSILRRLKNQFTITESFDNYTTLPERFAGGVRLSNRRAMQLATVWACVKIRAETIGSLPVGVIEERGAVRVPKPPPVWLQRPNPETTRYELFERTSASIDTTGDSFWFLARDKLKRVAEVWPLPSERTVVFRDGPEKRFRFDHEEFGSDEVLHISGFSLPGRLRGLNPIDQHMHALGLAVAAEEYGEAFFGNGAVMSGVIEHPGALDRDQAALMRQSFAKDHSGTRKAHLPGVLFGGAKWSQLTIPNDNAQFLETRKYQRSEICSIFRVPPHKIGDLDRATFSNIEQMAMEWVSDGLLPMTTRFESAILAAGMLDRDERLKFRYGGLLRGDTLARYRAYSIGRQWGWLSADDIRALEDENPLPDGIGETYLEPLNMVPAGERPELDDPVSQEV